MVPFERRTVLYWATLGCFAVLCFVLGVLQYRWIGEVGRAEQERIRAALQSALFRLSADFNAELAKALADLQPASAQIETLGREQAYSAEYLAWKNSSDHSRLFSRVALAIPENGTLVLKVMDLATAQFSPSEWPAAWESLRNQLFSRLNHGGPGPFTSDSTSLLEVPRFGRRPRDSERRGVPEQEWLIVEVSLDYVRTTLIPNLLVRHLGADGSLEYEAEVIWRTMPSQVVFTTRGDSQARIGHNADASVTLFDVPPGRPGGRGFRNGPRGDRLRMGPPTADTGRGRWMLMVRSQAGSLNAVVERTRWRNLAISGVILLLLLATVAVLLWFSRQGQKLAQLQMNFVANVSHELRTPLTVIRTAAFNLKRKLASEPAQAERYGELIEKESEKLTALVEQVLRFASVGSGRAAQQRAPVAIENVIEEGLRSSLQATREADCRIEKHLQPGLPPVMADELALRHALQNLLENALKYGVNGSNWIGVSASKVLQNGVPSVEIRVADRGPGIPGDEQEHIFDPFFRGQRAIRDQIHGTGLGLSLVKKIVEAHGGTVRVNSEPMKGTEFVVTLPAVRLDASE